MKEEDAIKYADVYEDLKDWDSQKEAVKEAFMRGYEAKNKEEKYACLRIQKSDMHYLYKLLRNGQFKAEENFRKTEDMKPLNDIWKDTLEVNKRIQKEIERFDLL